LNNTLKKNHIKSILKNKAFRYKMMKKDKKKNTLKILRMI